MNLGIKLRVPVTKKDHTIGPENAPLELVEYGDYECPYSGRAHPVVKEILRVLGNDSRYAYRHFPLTQIHSYAMSGAQAAETAALQGKFWGMHDILFANQESLDGESLLQYAGDLNLDLEKFSDDFASPEVEEKIFSDIEGGARSGVPGTPTFYINGIRYDGDWSFESLLEVLEGHLKRVA